MDMAMDPKAEALHRLAVAAERERCAKIAENWLEIYGATQPQHIDAQTWAGDAVRDIAELIRHPKPIT